jgi:hypothetical protein
MLAPALVGNLISAPRLRLHDTDFRGFGSVPYQFQAHVFVTFYQKISICCPKYRYLTTWQLCHLWERINMVNWHCCKWERINMVNWHCCKCNFFLPTTCVKLWVGSACETASFFMPIRIRIGIEIEIRMPIHNQNKIPLLDLRIFCTNCTQWGTLTYPIWHFWLSG